MSRYDWRMVTSATPAISPISVQRKEIQLNAPLQFLQLYKKLIKVYKVMQTLSEAVELVWRSSSQLCSYNSTSNLPRRFLVYRGNFTTITICHLLKEHGVTINIVECYPLILEQLQRVFPSNLTRKNEQTQLGTILPRNHTQKKK